MDVSREALLDELNDFEKKRPSEITPVLEEYLLKIAKCGDTMFPWSKFKLLIRKKLEVVMSDFHEGCPTDNLPPIPNVELFKFDSMKCKILEAVDAFQSTPFTIQRLCELLTSPKKHYKRTDKFMRGIEKNILVVSTVEPRHIELINNNGSLVVNGVLEVSTEGEMLVSSQKDMDSDNNLNNNDNHNMFIQQHERVTVNGVPLPEGLFTADPSSSNCSNSSTNLGIAPEMESSSEDSSDSSTDSSAEYAPKESSLEAMSDMASLRGGGTVDIGTVSSTVEEVSEATQLESLPTAAKKERDDLVATVGAMEEADAAVQEETRQLLSQVAANIEENSLPIESSKDSAKFPVSGVIMDTSLELGFNLGKELTSNRDRLSTTTADEELSTVLSGDKLEEPRVSSPLPATVSCHSPISVPLFPEVVEAGVETISMLISDPVQMEETISVAPVESETICTGTILPSLLDAHMLSGDNDNNQFTPDLAAERMETETCLSEQCSVSTTDTREPSLEDQTSPKIFVPVSVETIVASALEPESVTEEPVVLAFEKGQTADAVCTEMDESDQRQPVQSEPEPKQPSEEPMDQD